MAIYASLLRFRSHILARATGITTEDVQELASGVELSDLYFPNEISEMAANLLKSVREIQVEKRKSSELRTSGGFNDANALDAELFRKLNSVRTETETLAANMKRYVRVGAT